MTDASFNDEWHDANQHIQDLLELGLGLDLIFHRLHLGHLIPVLKTKKGNSHNIELLHELALEM